MTIQVTGARLSAIFLGLSTAFNDAFKSTQTQWPKIATEVPSNNAYQQYTWLDNFPGMKEWVGAKQKKKLSEYEYVIRNKSYEATVVVSRDDIEDDQLGIYKPQAEGAAYSAAQWPDELVFKAVNEGFNSKCYDGQSFFSTAHPVGSKKVSNKGTKKLSIVSLDAAKNSYGAARTALREMKDEAGRPLNVNPNILLVPPALEDIAKSLMTSEQLRDGENNIYKGTAEVVVAPWLTSSSAWFLLDCTKPLKPFIYQPRKKPVFVSQTDPNADDVFNKAEYAFGAEARGAAGYGHWQLAYGSDGSVD